MAVTSLPRAAARSAQSPSAPPSTPCSPDALLGMTWWNRITRPERAYWLDVADSFVPADAWAAFKRGAK
jgi:hypothetical protein